MPSHDPAEPAKVALTRLQKREHHQPQGNTGPGYSHSSFLGIQRLAEMNTILAQLSLDFSWRGIALTTCVSALLSALVIFVLRRAQSAGADRRRWIWIGGIVLGCGIWGVCFLDAAIHRPDGAAGLDLRFLLLALAVAILLACAGMRQAVAGQALWRFFIGGGLVGAAIAGASQIMMIASPGPSDQPWSIGLVFAVTALVMALASAALVVAEDEATKRANIIAAVLLWLAIMAHQLAKMGLTIVSSEVDRFGHIDLLSSATLMTVFAIAAIVLLILAVLGARANDALRERDRRLNLAINAMSQDSCCSTARKRSSPATTAISRSTAWKKA